MSWGFGFDCCCGCELYADDFATDRLATRWEERENAWVVTGGQLEATPDAATLGERSILIAAETIPASVSAIHLTTQCRGDLGNASRDVNGVFMLIFAWEDDDSFWYAAVDLGGSGGPTLSIVQRFDDGGGPSDFTHATVDVDADGDGGTLSVCYSSARVVATLFSGAGTASVEHGVYIDLTDTRTGLGALIDGTAIFDNFALSKHESDEADCPTCDEVAECPYCEAYGAPSEISVTLAGILGCPAMNMTFALAYLSGCTYQIEGESPCNAEGDPQPLMYRITGQIQMDADHKLWLNVTLVYFINAGAFGERILGVAIWRTPVSFANLGDACDVGELVLEQVYDGLGGFNPSGVTPGTDGSDITAIL